MDPAAATEGIALNDGVGLFMAGSAFWSGTRAKLASVAMLEADMLRAGDAGRAEKVDGEPAGFRMAVLLIGLVWPDGGRGIAGGRGAESGALVEVVGVA